MKKNLKIILFSLGISTFFLVISLFIFQQSLNSDHTKHKGISGFSVKLENFILDSYTKLRYRLKRKFNKLKKPNDIAIVGIDNSTMDYYGIYGTGDWQVRSPFYDQLMLFQNFFQPSCISYDIIFNAASGKIQKLDKISLIENSNSLKDVAKSLNNVAENPEAKLSNEELLKLSRYLADMGELNLAFSFSSLETPENEKLKPIPIICAFNFEFPAISQENKQEKDIYKWTQEDVLGDDPEDLDEEMGKKIPFLKKNAIPLENINLQSIPPDYIYAINGNMLSDNLSPVVTQAYINTPRDSDAKTRRIPLIMGTKYYHPQKKKIISIFTPSYALQSCLFHWGITPKDVSVEFGKYITVKLPNHTIKKIPIDRQGNMLVNYTLKANEFYGASFSDIYRYGAYLQNKETNIQPEIQNGINSLKKRLIGKIALIGMTYTGNPDIGPTPIDDFTALVFVHASAINNILSDNFLTSLPTTFSYILLIILASLMGFFGGALKVSQFYIVSLLLFLGYLGFTFYFFYYNSLIFPIVIPATMLLFVYLGIIILRYFTEEKDKQFISNMFSTMVSGDVLAKMQENPDSFSLSGSKVEATIMFSDVAGFTTISEGLTPEELVSLLNKYLTPMTNIILDSHGYVDKYEGDAIMAEWGAIGEMKDHAIVACFACLDQQKKLSEIRQELYEEFGHKIHIRLGVNSGIVSAGNMGSEKRFSYTVMGDAVNMAARLEPTNKIYGTEIMIGERTYELAQEYIEARFIDRIVVMGKSVPIKVYELLERKGKLDQDMQKVVQLYEQAREIHETRDWDKAEELLKQALKIKEDDSPSQTLLKRIQEYRETPPGDDWQGEYVRTSKD